MTRDFTLFKYKELLQALGSGDFTFKNYVSGNNPFAVIRHDVDRPPKNVLQMAMLENELGIKATYFFRVSRKLFIKEIISKIYILGHEVGYHYEVVDKAKGNLEEAIKIFNQEWELFSDWKSHSICMHGNPLSKFDNKAIWNKYNFKNYDVQGEGYLSMDFSKYFYFSDTGRTWNSASFSVKDKSNTKTLKIKNTNELIYIINQKEIQNFYILTHPSKWNDKLYPWLKELVLQNLKNQIKKHFVKHT